MTGDEAEGAPFPMYVTFAHPENGYKHDQDLALHLEVGKTYKLREARVFAWSTTYELVEVPGMRFNSVLFEPADKSDMSDVQVTAEMLDRIGDYAAQILEYGDPLLPIDVLATEAVALVRRIRELESLSSHVERRAEHRRQMTGREL